MLYSISVVNDLDDIEYLFVIRMRSTNMFTKVSSIVAEPHHFYGAPSPVWECYSGSNPYPKANT
jgi:hypothetical protein